MANRDIILSIIVLAGIGWLLFENYHQRPQKDQKPATIERVQPQAK